MNSHINLKKIQKQLIKEGGNIMNSKKELEKITSSNRMKIKMVLEEISRIFVLRILRKIRKKRKDISTHKRVIKLEITKKLNTVL